jgi:regulator of protease activity HflC (stomatin/prohibitin superfamily)
MEQLLSIILGIMFFPLTLLGSWVVVAPQEVKLILFWGTLDRVVTQPGLSFVNLWGRRVISISTKRQAIELHKTTVADANGNPIIIAAICTYEVVDAVKAALSVEDYQSYIRTQSIAVLKQVASKHPYESPDGHCLKSEAQIVGQEMVSALQTKVDSAGVRIIAFELSDLSYAPEIAQAMLVRQQAQALIGARRIVVEGAVEIANDAMQHLTQRGFKISDNHQAKIVGNLLAIICGEAKVQPTYAIQDYESADDVALLKSIHDELIEIKANTKKPSS